MELKIEKIEGWELHALEFTDDNDIIKKVVYGEIMNRQTKSRPEKKLEWQQKIAKEIKSVRGSKLCNPLNNYAISLGMKFSRHENQNQPLDVDNFIKPIFAGIAAGLFSSIDQNPTNINDFRYDDSRFRYLYVERLDDHAEEEGIAIVISEKCKN